MKLRYEAKKNARFKKVFMGITPRYYEEDNWWYCRNLKRWIRRSEMPKEVSYGSHQRCNSVRAFRHKLKTAPFGVEFRLCGRYVGTDIFGKGKSLAARYGANYYRKI